MFQHLENESWVAPPLKEQFSAGLKIASLTASAVLERFRAQSCMHSGNHCGTQTLRLVTFGRSDHAIKSQQTGLNWSLLVPLMRRNNVMLIDGDEAFRVVPLGTACKSLAACHAPDHSAGREA